jgi:5'-nucleotidase (lipoprotein e(P4) family)
MQIIKKAGWREVWLVTVALFAASYTFTGGRAQQGGAMQANVGADNEYTAGAVLFQQTAGEYRALSYQAYNVARWRLDQDFKDNKKNKMRRAVVVDADETIIDNSPYQAMLLKTRQAYAADTWLAWCGMAAAKPLPGAVEFLQYAHSRGVRVFYVTNRREGEKSCTADNLRKLGFPEVTDETLLIRTDTSSKEPRRQSIAQKHRIALLLGDNLNDLAQAFEPKSIAERNAAVDNLRAEFGRRFIMLPNVMYGDWESAVYGFKNGLTEADKRQMRQDALRGY